MSIQISIPGPPIAKKRPKFVRRGKFVQTYNPQETEEGRWMTVALTQTNGVKLEGALKVDAKFYMPIPASASNRKCAAMISGEIQHTKKPDVDNMIKFCLDCLNGIAWHDDTQVVRLMAMKCYSAMPRTELSIEPIG